MLLLQSQCLLAQSSRVITGLLQQFLYTGEGTDTVGYVVFVFFSSRLYIVYWKRVLGAVGQVFIRPV